MDHYCEKCGHTMDIGQFYTSKRIDKYPKQGKLNQCKKCITMHVNNWKPETYLWILEEVDVPYVKEEWDTLLQRHVDSKKEITGASVLGKYLSKMKLNQYSKYCWDDTERLAEEAKNKKIAAMADCGYSEEAIAAELLVDRTPPPPPPTVMSSASGDFPSEVVEEPDDLIGELSDEDIIYLRMKWGKGYRAEEWIRMEQLYEDMMASYDIQGAGHKDTLIMICKTSLKANQLIDIGDVEGFQKMSKVYDSLMKAGKFTAAQNKSEKGEFIDSIGELVALCERDGFIPRYYVDGPQDKVDRTLADFQGYVRTLVTEEMNLGSMIESSMKEILADKEKEASYDVDDFDEDEAFEEQLFADTEDTALTTDDFIEFSRMTEEQENSDEQFLAELMREEVK